MDRAAILRQRYEASSWHLPFLPSPVIENDALMLGRRTVLARLTDDTCLDVEADQERLLVLLSTAYARQADPAVVKQIRRASKEWRRGEKASAHIELAFARFPPLRSDEDAFRLFLAEDLLAQGMTPKRLAQELSFDPTLLKYDPDQPRVSGGNGRESGRWTSGGATQAGASVSHANETSHADGTTEAFVGPPLAPVGVDAFLAETSPKILAALARFAARFSVPTAVFGALFIPSPNNSVVVQGALPDHPDVRYKLDRPEGLLSLTAKTGDGSDVTIHAQNQDGVYTDVATSTRIGLDLQGKLFLSWPAVESAIQAQTKTNSEPSADTKSDQKSDEPQVCPAPVKDIPHGSSERSKDYEDDVHFRVNPLAPIPREFAVMFINPVTGDPVYIDDCFRYAGDLVDGDMHKGDAADAKGPGLAALLLAGGNLTEKVVAKLEKQAGDQLAVTNALGLGLKWYFAEKGAADYVRRRFANDGFGRIVIGYMPPRSRR